MPPTNLKVMYCNALAGSDFADGIDQRTIAQHEGHGGEHAGLGGARGDVVHLRAADAAGLFHREGNLLRDQEARLLRHVAMPAEREREVRPQLRAHVAIVGEGGTAGLRRHRLGARARSGSLTPTIVDVGQFQRGVEIERRMPVRHADQHDAHAFPPFCRVAAVAGAW